MGWEGSVVISGREKPQILDGGEKGAVGGHEAVGHARGVEREAGIAVAIEEDHAPGAMSALGEKMDGVARSDIGGGEIASGALVPRAPTTGGAAKKTNTRFFC